MDKINMNDYILYVYKITNKLNKKIYVGQHIQHKNKKDKYFGSGKLLKDNIKKYGKINFTKEIIEYPKSLKKLNEREIYWIKKLDSTNFDIGYNITSGGNQCVPSKRFVKIIKNIRINMSEERKKEWYSKISKTMKDKGISKGKNNPMYGIEFTKERKEKINKTKKKNKHKHKYYTDSYKKQQSIKNMGVNNPMHDKNHTKESKKKMSMTKKEKGTSKGKNNSNYGKFGENSSAYIKIPFNIVNKIIDLYTNKFVTISTLIKKYNYSRYKITNELKNNNITISNGIYISEKNKNIIIDLYINKKYNIQQITNTLELKDKRSISNFLKNNQIS